MSLDPATLTVVACIMSAVIGALLFFSWWHDRRIAALGWWSLCCMASAVASLLYMLDGETATSPGRQAANGLFALAFSLSYGAAKCFGGKPMPWAIVATGPLLWFGFTLGFLLDFFDRLILMSAIAGVYGLMTARALWAGSGREMPSQRAASVVTAITAIYMLARPFGGPGLTVAHGAIQSSGAWMSVVGICVILYSMIFGFLIMAMAKEKSDLEYRRAALVDPLTGIANRRAFMADAAHLLASAHRARRPAAAIMFDLDNFKAVNDNHGHLIGDHTLVEFCAIARSRLPQRAAFGRLGGEEFALLVDGLDQGGAVELAELIRGDLVQMAAVIMGRPVAATVSAGVAASRRPEVVLAELMGAADSALYRAKALGRNRVVCETQRADIAAPRGAVAMAVA